jgi:hypothetical protein
MIKKESPNKGQEIDFAKLAKPEENPKDLERIYLWYKENVGTTLDAALATGILRNSITYYVDHLECAKKLQAIYKDYDKTTHKMAKHYTANQTLWTKPKYVQLSLFEEGES